YLHLPSNRDFRPALIDDDDVLILQSGEPLVAFYRFLYDVVGRPYHWLDRLSWSDDALRDFLSRPTTTLLVLYVRGTPAGYIELDAVSAQPDFRASGTAGEGAQPDAGDAVGGGARGRDTE